MQETQLKTSELGSTGLVTVMTMSTIGFAGLGAMGSRVTS
jgi:hypothetical protein